MATIKTFEDIESWQRARELSKTIYELTIKDPFSKDFSLKDQINRASGSIMDNIAEGFERGGNKEFIMFLSYARGSAGEVRSQLYRAFDRKHINQTEFDNLKDCVVKLSKMITSFMVYLQGSEFKGMKFHEPHELYNINH
jgi:four helix bundle protein